MPVAEAIAKAEELISKGATVFIKFTCEKCGNRLGFDEPNRLYTTGSCDKCGHVTEIKKCGFAVIFKVK